MACGKEDHMDKLLEHLKKDDDNKVRELLSMKADPSAGIPPFGWTALHHAAGYGAIQSCRFLLEARANVNATADDGETPLHLAAQDGKSDAIRLLVSAGAVVDARSEDGETPLHVAVQHIGSKNLDHLSLLLELKADPTAKDSSGRTALGLARVMTNRGSEIEAVLQPSRSESLEGSGLEQLLRIACHRGQADTVRHLLSQLPESIFKAAAPRCIVAAGAGGNVEIAELLLSSRADVCASDDHGTTALLAAADENAGRMVRWLLSKGADPKCASKDGATALMAAAARGSSDTVQALLLARADVDQQASNGWTALLAAAQSGRTEVAKLLLDAKAQLDLSSADGSTARALALAAGHHELTKVLDTRAKLVARKTKSATSSTAAPTEDTRDIDDLLASLGEGRKGGKSNKKEKTPSKPNVTTTATAEAPKASVALPVAPPTNEAAGKKKHAENKNKAEIAALQARLKAIASKRRDLDKEEAEVKKELAALGV